MQAVAETRSSRLVLQSRLGELQRLASWVETTQREASLTSEEAFALQLCLEEAVANIVMYGGAAHDALIAVQIAPSAGAVTAVIEDMACAFDPTQVSSLTKPLSLHEACIGGLGVHLIRHYSSQMRYERREDRNRLTLIFDRSKAAGEDAGR